MHDQWSMGVEEEVEELKERSGQKQKKMRVEVESELESDGSREDRLSFYAWTSLHTM